MHDSVDDSHSATGLILLAAGGSTRLGQPKQLLQIDGKTLLRRAAESALASGCAPVVVVLGADAAPMRVELDDLTGITTVHNPDWREGMSSSLRCGIAALESETFLDATVILLCDQPYVTPEILRALVAARADGDFAAAVSVYASGASGPPCVVARVLFADLMMLTGAEGAKQVLRRLPEEVVVRVPFLAGDADIDTVEDWARCLDTSPCL